MYIRVAKTFSNQLISSKNIINTQSQALCRKICLLSWKCWADNNCWCQLNSSCSFKLKAFAWWNTKMTFILEVGQSPEMQRVHSSEIHLQSKMTVVFSINWQQISLNLIRELQEKVCTPPSVISFPVSIRFKSDILPDGRFCFLLWQQILHHCLVSQLSWLWSHQCNVTPAGVYNCSICRLTKQQNGCEGEVMSCGRQPWNTRNRVR